ncbi:MAG TPA: 5-dehydro-4-deoxyglucarate dehydratase [Acidothermaceae bacterium]|jgi:5-dehydro-4-deoxyglucarate dehydratase
MSIDTIGKGLLSFPVTPFAGESVDVRRFAEHVEWLTGFGPAGLFAAGGTGEFYALTLHEIEVVVRTAVEAVDGRLPVMAPSGFSLPMAVDLARRAEARGASGVLLFPPYLIDGSQAGLADYVRTVCQSTGLPVIIYHRSSAQYEPDTVARLADELPNLVGLKDGVGDLDLLGRIISTAGEHLMYIGGIPTAEMIAVPSLALGVSTYSSAIFNFLPTFAMRFYNAVRAGDAEYIRRAMREFLIPYSRIRSREKGYAVAIVKAGMTVVGRTVGPTRAPVSPLRDDELELLRRLVAGPGSELA